MNNELVDAIRTLYGNAMEWLKKLRTSAPLAPTVYTNLRRDGSTYIPLSEIPTPEAPAPQTKVTGAWKSINKDV